MAENARRVMKAISYEIALEQQGSIDITYFEELEVYRMRFSDDNYKREFDVTLVDTDITSFLKLFSTVLEESKQPTK